MRTAYEHLRQFALGFPEAHEEFPWGECAVKVRGKTFLFMSIGDDGLRLSVKLPASREFALEYPFTKPTRYGLGKSGWVTSSFATAVSRNSTSMGMPRAAMTSSARNSRASMG